nr:TVP38/TMEM64 family protein [Halobacterium sp. TGN-42-S1]
MFTTPRDRVRALTALVVLTGAVAAATLLLARALPDLGDPRAVREWVRSFGTLAPVAFVALQATQVVVAPVPGQVLGFAGGYLFGATTGTALSLAGATIGSVVVFVAARRLGRPFVEDVLDPEVLSTFDDLVARGGPLVLFLVFLLPGLPDDAICLLAGLTTIPIWQLTVVSLVGRLPGYFLTAYAGDRAAASSFTETAVLLAALTLVAGVAYVWRDAVVARLE